MKANIKNVNFAYIRKWEGLKSSDPKDPAAKYPCPTLKWQGRPLHTNIGVTWAAFKHNFPNATEADFDIMKPDFWLAIYERGYWQFMKAGEVDSQAIGELLADWAWGSGYYAATGLQKTLKANGYPCVVDGIVGMATIGQLNAWIKASGQRVVFAKLYAARMTFLQSLQGWKLYGLGWGNRMKSFNEYAQSIMI